MGPHAGKLGMRTVKTGPFSPSIVKTHLIESKRSTSACYISSNCSRKGASSQVENEGKQEAVILEENRHTHNAQRCWRCSGTACAGLLTGLR